MFGFCHVDSLSKPVVFVRSLRGLFGALLLSLVLVGTTSCGTDEKPVTIPPFANPKVDLVVDATYSLKVNLNQPAPDPLTVAVAVEAAYTQAFQFIPAKLTYNRGEQAQTVRVTGKAPTASQYAEVTFTIDTNGAQQVWRVNVSEPGK